MQKSEAKEIEGFDLIRDKAEAKKAEKAEPKNADPNCKACHGSGLYGTIVENKKRTRVVCRCVLRKAPGPGKHCWRCGDHAIGREYPERKQQKQGKWVCEGHQLTNG